MGGEITVGPGATVSNDLMSVNMDRVKVRYWFSEASATDMVADCDYWILNCSSLTPKFVSMANPTAAADHYLELSFMSQSLVMNTGSSPIQIRIHHASYAAFTSVNDDWSYANNAAAAPAPHITAYIDGVLAWGMEPGGGGGGTTGRTATTGGGRTTTGARDAGNGG